MVSVLKSSPKIKLLMMAILSSHEVYAHRRHMNMDLSLKLARQREISKSGLQKDVQPEWCLRRKRLFHWGANGGCVNGGNLGTDSCFRFVADGFESEKSKAAPLGTVKDGREHFGSRAVSLATLRLVPKSKGLKEHSAGGYLKTTAGTWGICLPKVSPAGALERIKAKYVKTALKKSETALKSEPPVPETIETQVETTATEEQTTPPSSPRRPSRASPRRPPRAEVEALPLCKALLATVQQLLEDITAKHGEIKKAAFDATSNLANHKQVAGQENKSKLNSAEQIMDAFMQVTRDKLKAQEAKKKVGLMVETCSTLSSESVEFKVSSFQRAEFQRQLADETLSKDTTALKQKTLAAEDAELASLLGLLEGILEAKKEVEDKDKVVGVGAAVGIQAATGLVEGYVTQLQARKELLASYPDEAFAKFMPLKPENAKLLIDTRTEKSIELVVVKLGKIIAAKAAALEKSFEKIEQLGESGKASNATSAKELFKEIHEGNIASANAEDLKGTIEKTIQRINVFFAALAAYKSQQAEKKAAATSEIFALKKKAAEIRKKIDNTMLLDAAKFFQLYALMWARAAEAKEVLPEEKEAFAKVRGDVTSTAVAVHLWLNQEMSVLCDHFKASGEDRPSGCMEVRKKVFQIVEKEVNYCDERYTETYCTQHHSGYAPSGRTCQWIPADNSKGIEPRCKTRFPESRGPPPLKYHQDHEDGAGIFY